MRYLAIGNSLTLHGKCDYWWNEVGMAATCAEKDYFHRVLRYLEETCGAAEGRAYNFAAWETQHEDRAARLPDLDALLAEGPDLITLQLGENARELATWEADFTRLIRYIQRGAPGAKLLVLGDFWAEAGRDEGKARAAAACGVPFLPLGEIKENAAYQCGLGTAVLGDDGTPHTVEHPGVAKHPGDRGMEAIAARILRTMNDEEWIMNNYC